jgi:hypothetical protein
MSSRKQSTSRKSGASAKRMTPRTMKRTKGGATASFSATQKSNPAGTLLPAVQTGEILPYIQPAP